MNILNIIVDAMGGDNAPNDIVKGCMKAIDEVEGFNVLLIGDAENLQYFKRKQIYTHDRNYSCKRGHYQ